MSRTNYFEGPTNCDICGKELPDFAPGNQRRHKGACVREKNRQNMAARRAANKHPVRLVVEFGVESGGEVFDRLSCGHLVELISQRQPARTCRQCPVEAEVAA